VLDFGKEEVEVQLPDLGGLGLELMNL